MSMLLDAVKSVSPRYRRWKRLLRSLTLDPDALARPVAAPSDRDFIICGCPRSGTSLLCAALYQPPSVVTVMEPWDGMRLDPADLFASLRAEILATRKLTRGRLDVGTLEREGSVRWGRDGAYPHSVATEPGFLLGVKWPAYWRLIELLPETRFLVCLRHPADVVASFRRQGGGLREGLEYDIPFNRAMNEQLLAATPDPALRRILLYDHVNGRLLPNLDRPNVLPVRYERWFTDPDALLAEIGSFLGVDLGSGPARIHAPEGDSGMPPDELEFLAAQCRTGAELGYPLEPVLTRGGLEP